MGVKEMDLSALDPADDIGLLSQVVAAATTDSVLRRLVEAGFADVRVSHGFIFQGLVAGDTTITQLAQRLDVSAQAVSKSVTELVEAGYLERRADDQDRRSRIIALTDRATSMLAVSRQARLAVAAEIAGRLGATDTRKLTRLLRDVAEHYGGIEAISRRRVRPVNGLD
jgi:DNA-binding MarR family transcriptional regulator